MLTWIRLFTLRQVQIGILLLLGVMQSAIASIEILRGSILSLHASIVSVCGPLCLRFDALQLQNFVLDAHPDAAIQNNADPDPQP